MEQIEAGAYVEKDNNVYILKPRTVHDKILIESFINDNNGKYVNLRLMKRSSGKSYEQTKAFWALVTIFFEINFGYKPNEEERNQMYDELLEVYFPRKQSLLDKDKTVPKHWSELSVNEGIKVIGALLEDLGQAGDIPDELQLDCKKFFEWYQQKKNEMYKDPCDYGDDGLPLSKAEWADKNRVCMVTGIYGGDICHIVSRQMGVGHEWLVNQSWNFYRADHRIHINIQHMQGWDALFKIAPHLKPRYERAFRLYHEGLSLINQGYSEEEITRHLAYSDKPENDVPIEHSYSNLSSRQIDKVTFKQKNTLTDKISVNSIIDKITDNLLTNNDCVTIKQIAEQLNTSPKVIIESAKKNVYLTK